MRARLKISSRTRAIILQSLLLMIATITIHRHYAQAISIRPADFDRFIMPCYLGHNSNTGFSNAYAGSSAYNGGGGSQSAPYNLGQQVPGSGQQPGPPSMQANGGQSRLGASGSSSNVPASGYNPPASYYGANDVSASRSTGSYIRDGFSSLGQQIPRANTMDNFIALVSKIEAANPRLANNPDQLIRMLLSRFRMDNYYYDVKSRTPIGDIDQHRVDILPALLNATAYESSQSQSYQYQQSPFVNDDFQEYLLDPDEKCSMYFMLSHFIVKESPLSPPLQSIASPQLVGPQGGQRPPNLQAAGAGYPGASANMAFSSSSSQQSMGGNQGPPGINQARPYPGPAQSFGSPATQNMNSFGSGIQADPNANNQYGINVLDPNDRYRNLNLRNPNAYTGNAPAFNTATNSRLSSTPYIDGGARMNDQANRMAIEYGVVTLQNQENAAIVLNRVLMGLLAANTYPKAIKDLVALVYPYQSISATSKLADDIDPLYAVTMADLWAVSAIPKAGKSAFDSKLFGDNGRWNDTMCPTSFILERANSIKFTTAELLGGLDGLNLGTVRKMLLADGKNLRLSDLLRMYYSKSGFRPQYAEYGICTRATVINTRMDEIRRQAENYLRLYQLNLPTSDNDLAMSIVRLDSFKEYVRQSANQYLPQDICQDSNNYNDIYPMDMSQEQCELGKADIISVLDSSQQANQLFMNLVLIKLAQKIGLSRTGNSLTILTNQQDSTGSGGGGQYSFNPILRNSTNTAEIGCSLAFDTTRSYQGGQITEPTRLIEMFERSLVNLDTEYLIRQNMNQQTYPTSSWTSSYKPSTYVSSLFTSGMSDNYLMGGLRPKNTGGSKVILWFNYGSPARMSQIASGPTNWNQQPPSSTYNNQNNNQDNQYRLYEAKKYLRENFRGASILAITNNRDDVKPVVYDEQRDIFTDIPAGSSSSLGSSGSSYDYYTTGDTSSSSSYNNINSLNGPADILVNKLLQRMCDIPASFQYPMCFQAPSVNAPSVGYISPKRKQYWMMSPKTYFSSKTVRMVFKVDGGRLRVCFGRMPKPDETALKNPNQQQLYGSISFGSSSQYSVVTPSTGQSQNPANQANAYSSSSSSSSSYSGNNYYTGMEYGVCKDVSPGQEIDFIVDDPCYKKPIADCEPFYFVIKDITNPGEGDMNYMCRDAGCKRFDQIKFTMTHTGVQCNGAFKSIKTNWFLIMISLFTTLYISSNSSSFCSSTSNSGSNSNSNEKTTTSGTEKQTSIDKFSKGKGTGNFSYLLAILTTLLYIQQVLAQLSAPADYGQGRYGEKRGNFTPSEVLAIILLIMTIAVGLALTIGLCYYVSKRNNRGMTRVQQSDFA